MSDDIDFDQLIDLLDRALVSDDPKVKKALKKFLFITALATEDEETEGPLKNLIRRIEDLEAKVNSGGWGGGYTWPPNTSPTWPGPYWVGGGTTTSAGTTYYSFNDGSSTANTTYTAEIGDDVFPKVTSSTSIDTLIDDSMRDLEDLQKQASNLQK